MNKDQMLIDGYTNMVKNNPDEAIKNLIYDECLNLLDILDGKGE